MGFIRFLIAVRFFTVGSFAVGFFFLKFPGDGGLGFFGFRSARALEMYLSIIEVLPLVTSCIPLDLLSVELGSA